MNYVSGLWTPFKEKIMSECPFCKSEVPSGASVCGNCGAEEVVGYVSQQTVKGLVALGALFGIPTGIVVAVITHSPLGMLATALAVTFAPLTIVKVRSKNKISWVRRSAQ